MQTTSTKNIILAIALCIGMSATATSYAPPRDLKAAAYPAHVELTWHNEAKFTYNIYRLQGKKFVQIGNTNSSQYFDCGQVANGKTITYRIVPQGIDAAKANNCEVQTQMPNGYTDDDLLDMTQRYTTRYFHEFAHPIHGLARERSNNGIDMLTTGGTGFGIMVLVAAAERGYYSRTDVVTDISKIVYFLEHCERFHGAWAHWYNGNTGKPFHFSQYDDGGDLVETAFLVQGLLTARSYLQNGNSEERILCQRITYLWETVEWNWYTQGGSDNLYWHWSKNYGWKMNHRIKGFDETLITYILATSSPTYPISPDVYHKCYTNSDYFKNGKSYFGIPLSLGMEYGGPLFFTHYSFLGMNPNGLVDQYANYFERNRAHVLIHRAYAIANPNHFAGYGADLWGFTSSDDALVGYTSHHPGTEADNGTVSPTAALSSMPYTPEYSMEVLRNLYLNHGAQTLGVYGFYDAYNPSLPIGQQIVHSYLAIDQGPIAVMIENYRSGLIWKLFAQNTEINIGLEKLGFRYEK